MRLRIRIEEARAYPHVVASQEENSQTEPLHLLSALLLFLRSLALFNPSSPTSSPNRHSAAAGSWSSHRASVLSPPTFLFATPPAMRVAIRRRAGFVATIGDASLRGCFGGECCRSSVWIFFTPESDSFGMILIVDNGCRFSYSRVAEDLDGLIDASCGE
ncbi:hypothetical protein Droror1_Dr00019413 [Drosera rotundifolia]